jgi:hypothetical protein
MAQDETDWWFPAAESAFRVLESELGFEIVKRHYHFQGNFIVYERDDARFVVESGPDWNSLSGMLSVGLAGHRHGGEIETILASLDPTKAWRYNSSSGPIDRVTMVATMKLWATGIVTHLPTLLANTQDTT